MLIQKSQHTGLCSKESRRVKASSKDTRPSNLIAIMVLLRFRSLVARSKLLVNGGEARSLRTVFVSNRVIGVRLSGQSALMVSVP